jgi:hypothetical protein
MTNVVVTSGDIAVVGDMHIMTSTESWSITWIIVDFIRTFATVRELRNRFISFNDKKETFSLALSILVCRFKNDIRITSKNVASISGLDNCERLSLVITKCMELAGGKAIPCPSVEQFAHLFASTQL